MATIDTTYHKLLQTIIMHGYTYEDLNRKGVKRKEIVSYTFRHELTDGFPAITTKKLNFKNIVTELLWFLRGDTNIKYLVDNGCNIWNSDAYNHYCKRYNTTPNKAEQDGLFTKEEFVDYIKGRETPHSSVGDLGRVYGSQWRKWNSVGAYVDQLKNLAQSLKETPMSTQHIVTAWNPAELYDMALSPCHWSFQVVCRPLTKRERELHHYNTKFKHVPSTALSHKQLDEEGAPRYGFELFWSQRSVDTFLGLPYNIASYALLAHILEKMTGHKALAIQGDLKNVHLYDNQIAAAKEQLKRSTDTHNNCNLFINETTERVLKGEKSLDVKLDFLNIKDFELQNYNSYPFIKAEMLAYNKD